MLLASIMLKMMLAWPIVPATTTPLLLANKERSGSSQQEFHNNRVWLLATRSTGT
jgi:hypothetical protein